MDGEEGASFGGDGVDDEGGHWNRGKKMAWAEDDDHMLFIGTKRLRNQNEEEENAVKNMDEDENENEVGESLGSPNHSDGKSERTESAPDEPLEPHRTTSELENDAMGALSDCTNDEDEESTKLEQDGRSESDLDTPSEPHQIRSQGGKVAAVTQYPKTVATPEHFQSSAISQVSERSATLRPATLRTATLRPATLKRPAAPQGVKAFAGAQHPQTVAKRPKCSQRTPLPANRPLRFGMAQHTPRVPMSQDPESFGRARHLQGVAMPPRPPNSGIPPGPESYQAFGGTCRRNSAYNNKIRVAGVGNPRNRGPLIGISSNSRRTNGSARHLIRSIFPGITGLSPVRGLISRLQSVRKLAQRMSWMSRSTG